MPGPLDWLQGLLGGSPEGSGLGYAASATDPDALERLRGVLTGLPNTYDPNRSHRENALDPRGLESAMGMVGPTGLGMIRAFHGSPHSFSRFDMSRIGTGEGAQAYGHGLYFAGNEATARSYRDSLSNLQLHVDGKKVGEVGALGDDPLANAAYALFANNGVPQRAKSYVQQSMDRYAAGDFGYRPQTGDAILKAIDNINPAAVEARPGGHMYEVDIHADPQRLLDWDKPLKGQLPNVKQALERAGAAQPVLTSGQTPGEFIRRAGINRYNAADLFNRGRGELDLTPADVSARLNEAGIPGIRYRDQFSRAVDPDQIWPKSSNYAMFDDKLIEILRKYGILPPLAIGAGGGLLGPVEE